MKGCLKSGKDEVMGTKTEGGQTLSRQCDFPRTVQYRSWSSDHQRQEKRDFDDWCIGDTPFECLLSVKSR